MELKQYHVYLINLDPTIGHEIQKTRPCLIISPDEMNRHLQTVMIAPLTTKSHNYPSRVSLTFGGKQAWIVLDQIRTVDRRRLVKELGKISSPQSRKVKAILKEMLVD
ncbi:MAG TPA: type II toxin-antitoxin system PemK/MazF family toxin [Deltaproteobacteria bacterium]|nr:type II toxin-antitoxin system PemK/MazF family toxin [Deltaproteobacteria bacterium]HQB38080.1 type II toxin-antitoxin system PemK/MazF family toxin [Deltaproteobacteria bacterium]